jgi:hypothetical protein
MDDLSTEKHEKNIRAFAHALDRLEFKNSYKIAHFLIEKFAIQKNPSWARITRKMWEERIKIDNSYNSLYFFRDCLIKNKILICQANREQLLSDDAQPAASMYKIGERSQKYIDRAIAINLPQKVNRIEDKIELLEKENREIKNEMSQIKIILTRLAEDKAEEILRKNPPDTPERRRIVVGELMLSDGAAKVAQKMIKEKLAEEEYKRISKLKY